jgi:hypothetical protein
VPSIPWSTETEPNSRDPGRSAQHWFTLFLSLALFFPAAAIAAEPISGRYQGTGDAEGVTLNLWERPLNVVLGSITLADGRAGAIQGWTYWGSAWGTIIHGRSREVTFELFSDGRRLDLRVWDSGNGGDPTEQGFVRIGEPAELHLGCYYDLDRQAASEHLQVAVTNVTKSPVSYMCSIEGRVARSFRSRSMKLSEGARVLFDVACDAGGEADVPDEALGWWRRSPDSQDLGRVGPLFDFEALVAAKFIETYFVPTMLGWAVADGGTSLALLEAPTDKPVAPPGEPPVTNCP